MSNKRTSTVTTASRSSSVSSSSEVQRDLVTASLLVRAPIPTTPPTRTSSDVSSSSAPPVTNPNRLTGNLGGGGVVGKNTAWTKGPEPDGSVPRFTARKEYVEANLTHPFAESLLARHIDDDSIKRGLSCAEGHAVIGAHQIIKGGGEKYAKATGMEQLKTSLVGPEPKATGWADIASVGNQVDARNQAFDAFVKPLTGMDSWAEYAKHEASSMAWNDVQHHGEFTAIRHDPKSDVSPGKAMLPCPQCRSDIVSKMAKHSD